jgi:hypothetical protein
VKTKIIEGTQSLAEPGEWGNWGNWGKFMLCVPDSEWGRASRIGLGGSWPLLREIGWTPDHVWVLDLQTGEGAYFRPGGLASADLAKHRIWVCPLYEPFLEWLYARYRETPGLDIGGLPDVAELPDAPFALSGYRRPGPEGGEAHE